MNRNFTIRRLLAILMIAGLVLAPVSRPVMAEMPPDMSMQAMADDMSPSAMTSAMPDAMADDMPCCPSKAPVPLDCDKCVFMAACMSMAFTGLPASVVHALFAASDDIASLQNDSWPDGLGHPPPEHPPRTLV